MKQLVYDKVSDHIETSKLLAVISSLVFVIQLAGLVDLLQHIKNLSLILQTVNVLPWELEEQITFACDLLEQLADDLKCGDVSRTLNPTERSNGQRVPAFEFLSAHMAEFKKCTLSLHDPRAPDGAPLQTVELQLNAVRRASRVSNPLQAIMQRPGQSAGASPGDETDEAIAADIKSALTDLSKLAVD